MRYKLICYTGNEYTILEAVAADIEELKNQFSEWKHVQQNDYDLMFIIEGRPIIHDMTLND